MATDPEDVDLEMSMGPAGVGDAINQQEGPDGAGDAINQQEGPDGAGDVINQQEGPASPSAVPTVSEKVPADRVDGKKARVPRRVLHFSDGTMEEYSTDDEDEPDKPSDTLAQLRSANTKSMGWMPWAWYWFRFAGFSTLRGVDNVGERLAYMLGITSPKYQYELDEYYEMKRKEEEEQHQRDLESAGWTPGSAQTNSASNQAASVVPAGQSEPATSPPSQSGAVAALASDQPPADAGVVSGQPVASETRP